MLCCRLLAAAASARTARRGPRWPGFVRCALDAGSRSSVPVALPLHQAAAAMKANARQAMQGG